MSASPKAPGGGADSTTIGNHAAQESLFEEPDSVGTAAAEWDRNSAQRSIDELFQFARQYTSSESFNGLMRFIARFRLYSPFNAMLAHIQMPGATFVAPPYRWTRDYGRRIKPGARPVVLLTDGTGDVRVRCQRHRAASRREATAERCREALRGPRWTSGQRTRAVRRECKTGRRSCSWSAMPARRVPARLASRSPGRRSGSWSSRARSPCIAISPSDTNSC